ncbi:hypothetical protein DFH27DRAFT_607489 [Peziza echinospora]|nr:hypothetical protein DFH27DRAFT_607489 [Peziza echinospora]
MPSNKKQQRQKAKAKGKATAPKPQQPQRQVTPLAATPGNTKVKLAAGLSTPVAPHVSMNEKDEFENPLLEEEDGPVGLRRVMEMMEELMGDDGGDVDLEDKDDDEDDEEEDEDDEDDEDVKKIKRDVMRMKSPEEVRKQRDEWYSRWQRLAALTLERGGKTEEREKGLNYIGGLIGEIVSEYNKVVTRQTIRELEFLEKSVHMDVVRGNKTVVEELRKKCARLERDIQCHDRQEREERARRMAAEKEAANWQDKWKVEVAAHQATRQATETMVKRFRERFEQQEVDVAKQT